MDTEIRIEGLGEIQQNIDAMAKRLSYREVTAILLKGARVVSNAAKSKVGRVTGNLKRAIWPKRLPEKGNYLPTAIVAVRREKKAYHAHLVEKGTRLRKHKSGKATGVMPAKPFLEPAWKETQEIVLLKILNELKNKVEGG